MRKPAAKPQSPDPHAAHLPPQPGDCDHDGDDALDDNDGDDGLDDNSSFLDRYISTISDTYCNSDFLSSWNLIGT